MHVARLSVLSALLAFASCATTGPVIYSDSAKISTTDIQTAVALVQQRCIRERRGVLPIYRVDGDRFDRVFIHCGPHYGVATQQVPSRLSLNANKDLGISLACRNTRRIQKESLSPSVL